MVTLEGQQISNPTGWLVTVTFRRAIEEHRARGRLGWAWPARGGEPDLALEREGASRRERDLAAELDDRARLRQLFEALRVRLGAREREAAVLCYLQGLPRAQAASRMGLSEARMRKLMDGHAGRPGVAGEVGRFLETIRRGAWCEDQASLMRGLAFGLLDPEGERYRLALLHGRQCPACRAYVASLRGLAAALPPTLVAPGLTASMLGTISAARGARAGAAVSSASRAAASAGSGAPGAGSLAGGPLAAKLAAGGLVALALGAGSTVLELGSAGAGASAPPHRSQRPFGPSAGGSRAARPATAGEVRPAQRTAGPGRRPVSPPAGAPASRAAREFGPEHAPELDSGRPAPAPSAHGSGGRRASSAAAGRSELEFAPG